MPTLRKYRPIVLIAGCMLLTLGLLLGSIYFINGRASRRSGATALVPAGSGVWAVCACHRPVQVWEWQHSEHLLLEESGSFHLFDGNEAYRWDADAQCVIPVASGLELDYKLGAGGVTVHNNTLCYLPPEEPRWGVPEGMSVELQLRTLVTIAADGTRSCSEIPVSPAADRVFSLRGWLYTAAEDRNGFVYLISTRWDRSEQLTGGIQAAPGDRLYYDYDEGGILLRPSAQRWWTAGIDTFESYGPPWQWAPRARTYRSELKAVDICGGNGHHTLSRFYRGLYLENGSLYYREAELWGGGKDYKIAHCRLSDAQLDAAQYWDDVVAIPTNDGVRVYVPYDGALARTLRWATFVLR